MANWITHLMIADRVMKEFCDLDRLGFCVGNIAPDCNIENTDWTIFTPPLIPSPSRTLTIDAAVKLANARKESRQLLPS